MRIVSIGGGTGQATLLEALRSRAYGGDELTAIVTMSDNGGSSGVLRDRYGILPPSDLLRCAAVLSEYHPATRDIFAHRIHRGRKPYHMSGNLLMAAYEREYGRRGAVEALLATFNVRGRVLPVTYDSTDLCVSFSGVGTARNETKVDAYIRQGKHPCLPAWLHPRPRANPEVLQALRAADVIIIGPGSFYTSILPNFLVPGVLDAVAASRASILIVMNLLFEGATPTGSVSDVSAVASWQSMLGLSGLRGREADCVLFNSTSFDAERMAPYVAECKYPIMRTWDDPRSAWRPMWQDPLFARHDPPSLAGALTLELSRLREEKRLLV